MIFTCEQCGRFFTAGKALMDPQPAFKGFIATYGFPETFACELPDCAEVAAKLLPAPKPASPAPAPRPKRQRPISPRAHEYSACPPERDYTGYTIAGKPVTGAQTPAHADQVKAYVSSGNAEAFDNQIYALLNATFDGITPGQWVPNSEIRKLGVDATHSAFSRIRDRADMEGFDVDSKLLEVVRRKQHWAYRICRAQDSERLKREDEKKKRE